MADESTSLGVRLPFSLKDKLAGYAGKHHRSLNAEIALRLSESFHSNAQIINDIFDSIELGKVQRMRSSSTTTDTKRILTVLRHLDPNKIILGARKDRLNNAVLVFIAETPYITLLMDGSSINMARDPREEEVKEIFLEFSRLGLLTHVEYCKNLLPKTSKLTPDNALHQILEQGDIHQMRGISNFLKILSCHGIFDADEFRENR